MPPSLDAGVEERQIDGNYGEIYHNGHYQGDFAGFTGTLSIEQRALPRAGENTTVYRRGRISRTGSFTLTYIDSRFTAMMMRYTEKTADDRRADRAAGLSSFPDSQFIVRLDDPDSWGAEEIQLLGVKFWEIGLGYAPDTMIGRDLPCTWQANKLLTGVPRPGNKQGWTPPSGQQTWPAVGNTDLVI